MGSISSSSDPAKDQAEYVAEIVAAWPPFTPEQAESIAVAMGRRPQRLGNGHQREAQDQHDQAG